MEKEAMATKQKEKTQMWCRELNKEKKKKHAFMFRMNIGAAAI